MEVPAWKQAILEKKRKLVEEEKKKQAEIESYIASLPPWKQARIRERLEKGEHVNIPSQLNYTTKQVTVSKPRTTTNSDQELLKSSKFSSLPKTFANKERPCPVEEKQFDQNTETPKPATKKSCSDLVHVSTSNETIGNSDQNTVKSKPTIMKAATQGNETISPTVMPKWKQELLRRQKLKEQQAKLPDDKPQQQAVESTKQTEAVMEQPTQDHKSDVIHSSDNNDDSPKLIKKEGKILKPPVFLNSKWASITEDDPGFKTLPEWKKAVIRRRKADATKRTAPSESPVTEKEIVHSSITTVWSPSNEVPSSNTHNEEESKVPHWVKPLRHTAKSAPSLPKHEKDDKPLFASQLIGKKAEKLRERFSKPSDNTSNHITNDNETAAGAGSGVTMIDEESDDDAPPVSSSDRRESGLRRVSFSDSDLTTEYYYPKYDYSDYHEIVQEENTDGDETNGIATPIHPWLTPTIKSPPPKPDSTTVTLSTERFNSFDSLGDFMSAYTSNSYNYNNSSKGKSKGNNLTSEESKQSNDNFPTDTDTAALMF